MHSSPSRLTPAVIKPMEKDGSTTTTSESEDEMDCDENDSESVDKLCPENHEPEISLGDTPNAHDMQRMRRHLNVNFRRKFARVRVKEEVRKIEFYLNPKAHVCWVNSVDGSATFTLREAILGPPHTDVRERRDLLHADPDVLELTETNCACRGCGKFISHATKTTKYAVYKWIFHMVNCQSLQKLLQSEYPHATRFCPSSNKHAGEKRMTRVQKNRIILESDPLLITVEAYRVLCGPCDRWLALGNMTEYTTQHWWVHRWRFHRDVPGGIRPPHAKIRNGRHLSNHRSAPKKISRRKDDAQPELTTCVSEPKTVAESGNFFARILQAIGF
ncbi:hypothetical protein BD410DRAFT_783795 [Rickenella mellea]|uniref:Uncharacterized protein n=1 Tax=Rickenella mellea TaxID=50990 RepID=A0A4Y7QG70_9AGAM|nr:hypothetical protein BD410DRAFT_783795 [Rickenella mellea]